MILNRQHLFELGTCVVMRIILTSALTLKDSCVLVGPEIPDYHVQDEAVIISFPFLEDAIDYRQLRVDNSSTFSLDHTNLRNQSSLELCGDRVKQSERRVLLLPAHPSDTGTFSYTLRSDTFCLTGSISITVSEHLDLTVMPYSAHAGQDTRIICPHLSYFLWTERPKWYKDFQSAALPVGRGQYTVERGIILAIRNISVEDQGFYTCRLSVIFNSTRFNVSRTWRVEVSAPASESPITTDGPSAFTPSSHSFPYIVSPVNGSFIEARVGAGVSIPCVVFTPNASGPSTLLTWLIDGQAVENSHLAERALQTAQSVSVGHLEVQLRILRLQHEDNGSQLKCVFQSKEGKQEVFAHIRLDDSWSLWSAAAAASSCLLLVVCVFTYHLCRRPHKTADYILARQNSSV